jgi:hypothetical protein
VPHSYTALMPATLQLLEGRIDLTASESEKRSNHVQKEKVRQIGQIQQEELGFGCAHSKHNKMQIFIRCCCQS